MARPGVILERRLHLAVIQVSPFGIHHHHVPEQHINLRMLFKEAGHGRQCARQILLVAVQVGEQVPPRPAQPAVDAVIHALVLFHEHLDARVPGQPIQRAVVRLGILHDVLDLDTLVGHGSKAEPQPGRAAVARGDNRDAHNMRAILIPVERVFALGPRPINCRGWAGGLLRFFRSLDNDHVVCRLGRLLPALPRTNVVEPHPGLPFRQRLEGPRHVTPGTNQFWIELLIFPAQQLHQFLIRGFCEHPLIARGGVVLQRDLEFLANRDRDRLRLPRLCGREPTRAQSKPAVKISCRKITP